MLASDVVTSAATLLVDNAHRRWPRAELLGYLSEGRRHMMALRPDIYTAQVSMFTAAGADQTIPGSIYRLVSIDYVSSNTSSPKRAVRLGKTQHMDALDPGWRNATPGLPRHYFYDERERNKFSLYPPPLVNMVVGATVIADPLPEFVAETTNLVPEGALAIALIDFVCYRAFTKDADAVGNSNRATAHYQQFAALLGASNRIADVVASDGDDGKARAST